MIKACFRFAECFWLLAPCAFLVGKWLGWWNFTSDVFVLCLLMFMFFVVCAVETFIKFWNYRGDR